MPLVGNQNVARALSRIKSDFSFVYLAGGGRRTGPIVLSLGTRHLLLSPHPFCSYSGFLASCVHDIWHLIPLDRKIDDPH